jgi:hypothetical protein
MAATPIAPPIVRENWTSAVAEPRSCQETELWMTIRMGVLTVPSPRPMTAELSASHQTWEFSGRSVSIAAPRTSAKAPARTSFRYPTLKRTRPEIIDATGQPRDMGATTAPAW